MTAGYTIMSRLIEGEFLNYHNVIPAGSRTRVTIEYIFSGFLIIALFFSLFYIILLFR